MPIWMEIGAPASRIGRGGRTAAPEASFRYMDGAFRPAVAMIRSVLSSIVLAALAALAFSGCREEVEYTALAAAVARGEVEEVRALLEHAASDPDEIAASGWAPLHLASRHRDLGALHALLAAGADVELLDRNTGWTPLLHAIHVRNSGAVEALLEAGSDANRRGASGITPLAMAAGYGMADAVRLLLARGADPYAAVDGGNALWAAAGGGAIRDITDGPPLGQCFPEVIALLESRAPDLRMAPGLSSRMLVWLANDACEPVVARLYEKASSAHGP